MGPGSLVGCSADQVECSYPGVEARARQSRPPDPEPRHEQNGKIEHKDPFPETFCDHKGCGHQVIQFILITKLDRTGKAARLKHDIGVREKNVVPHRHIVARLHGVGLPQPPLRHFGYIHDLESVVFAREAVSDRTGLIR